DPRSPPVRARPGRAAAPPRRPTAAAADARRRPRTAPRPPPKSRRNMVQAGHTRPAPLFTQTEMSANVADPIPGRFADGMFRSWVGTVGVYWRGQAGTVGGAGRAVWVL